MIEGLEHIGIAVKDLKKAKALYQKLGFSVSKEERLLEMGLLVAFLPIGETKLELLMGIAGDDAISKFVEKKGEGIHHLAFKVKDIEGKLKELHEEGFRLIDQKPRIGALGKKVAFIHPKSTGGILMELIQE